MDIDASGKLNYNFPPKDKYYVVHIDADPVVYSVGFAAEEDPLSHVLHSVKAVLKDIVIRCGAGAWICHLTHSGLGSNFRHEIATIQPYKGGRDHTRRPGHYDAIRAYICSEWNGIVHKGYEADDGLAMCHYGSLILPGAYYVDLVKGRQPILASIDKDLRGIKGVDLFNPNHPDKGIEHYTEEVALRWFYGQCLTGDKIDNIKGLSLTRPEGKALGCTSVGPKSKLVQALDDLSTEKEYYQSVLKAYEERHDILAASDLDGFPELQQMQFLGPKAALKENATLLWMLEYPGQLWEEPE